MKKLYISADIEGTCGIAAWDETERVHADYAQFSRRMSLEVAAACRGALQGGMDQVLVRDAHDSARNIDFSLLPRGVELLRGWGAEPLCMMAGIDDSFAGAVFTGYHDLAGSGSNPLAHTMSTGLSFLTLNGEPLSEAVINLYTASHAGVPLIMISGDAGICARIQALVPGVRAVAVNRGTGGMVQSMHPEAACEAISEAVREACLGLPGQVPCALPDFFRLDVRYSQHKQAYRAGFYPGVRRLDSHTLRFEATDWYEVLRMMHFCL